MESSDLFYFPGAYFIFRNSRIPELFLRVFSPHFVLHFGPLLPSPFDRGTCLRTSAHPPKSVPLDQIAFPVSKWFSLLNVHSDFSQSSLFHDSFVPVHDLLDFDGHRFSISELPFGCLGAFSNFPGESFVTDPPQKFQNSFYEHHRNYLCFSFLFDLDSSGDQSSSRGNRESLFGRPFHSRPLFPHFGPDLAHRIFGASRVLHNREEDQETHSIAHRRTK